ncbi:MAG: hypothetical protein O2890_14875 [Cyanobacteria bacterium]|nr:hypothetical protein [Cyanobacteriota bacterium]
MGSTPQTNLRLSPAVKDAAVAAAAARGVSLARLVEMALSAYLEGLPDDTGGMVPHDPILPRLEAIEQRLSALEGDTGGIPDSTTAPAPPPPPPAPAPRAGGEGEGDTLSDATLRRRWNAAGGMAVVGAYLPWAASQGWVRVGKGNRAVWRS